jgi:hypothetical protein
MAFIVEVSPTIYLHPTSVFPVPRSWNGIASGASQDEADHVPVDGFGNPFVDVTKSNPIQKLGRDTPAK